MRKAAGKSVSEVADFLEMTAPAYRRYERGEVDPKISQCIEIVNFLGCRIQDVWGADEVPETVNVSYTAKPGQTVYVKVDYDDAEYKTKLQLKNTSESDTKVAIKK